MATFMLANSPRSVASPFSSSSGKFFLQSFRFIMQKVPRSIRAPAVFRLPNHASPITTRPSYKNLSHTLRVVAVDCPYSATCFFYWSMRAPSHSSAATNTPDSAQQSVFIMKPSGVGFLGRKVMCPVVAPAHSTMVSSMTTNVLGSHDKAHF